MSKIVQNCPNQNVRPGPNMLHASSVGTTVFFLPS